MRLKNWGELIPNDNMAMLMYSEAFATANNEGGPTLRQSILAGRTRLPRRTHARTRPRCYHRYLATIHGAQGPAVFDQMQWLPIDPNGRINPVTLGAAQDWFAERGYVPSKVDLTKVIEPSVR